MTGKSTVNKINPAFDPTLWPQQFINDNKTNHKQNG